MLRYLADAYKALRQTVPDEARTEELDDLTEWLGELVRQVDSSLLDEWEALRNPEGDDGRRVVAGGRGADAGPPPVTTNVRAFRVLVRNSLFRRVELAGLGRYSELGELDAAAGWDADAWADAVEDYLDVHGELATGPDARGPRLLVIDTQPEGRPRTWLVRQIFDDQSGDHDWGIGAEVDLDASDEAGEAVVRVTSVGEFELFSASVPTPTPTPIPTPAPNRGDKSLDFGRDRSGDI